MEIRNKEKRELVEVIYLNPEEIITLNDFPVHSLEVLKEYYQMCQKGLALPPVPVIEVEAVEPFLDTELLDEFRKKHASVKYIMLDGSHRTTAQTLNNLKIPAIEIESDRDIRKAEEMVESGALYGLSVGDSFNGCIKALVNHFERKPGFQTVREKTEKMIQERVIPQYMIDQYRKL